MDSEIRDITSLGRELASSERQIREKSLEDVRNLLLSTPFNEINEGDMMKLWLGLYMSMWMADKPLLQEKLAISLASLMDCLTDSNEVFLFVGAFFKTIRREWSKIDRLRIDKFYMLIRAVLGRTLQYVQQQKWDQSVTDQYLQLMAEALTTSQASALADGVTFHLVDIFLNELKKVQDSHLSKENVVVLLRPFGELLATTPDFALRSAITETIFEPLAVAMEMTATPKLAIDHITLSTEFYNLAKDAALPRSTANRKCLYQLHERFANLRLPVDSDKQGGNKQKDVAVSKESTKSKKWKGGDVSPKETGKKPKDGKGRTNIDASSKNTDVVSTESDSHGIYKETVSGIALPQITKTTRVKRKRSRSSMSAASEMLLEQSDDGDNKKRKSIDSSTCRRENDVTNKDSHHKQKKRQSLPNFTLPSDNILLLEDNAHDHQRTTPSPLRMVIRSGEVVRRAQLKEPQLKLHLLATDKTVASPSPSKKVQFALQRNQTFDHQPTGRKQFDDSLKPSKSALKASEHSTTKTPSPPPPSKTVATTRRKSSRFLKHT